MTSQPPKLDRVHNRVSLNASKTRSSFDHRGVLTPSSSFNSLITDEEIAALRDPESSECSLPVRFLLPLPHPHLFHLFLFSTPEILIEDLEASLISVSCSSTSSGLHLSSSSLNRSFWKNQQRSFDGEDLYRLQWSLEVS